MALCGQFAGRGSDGRCCVRCGLHRYGRTDRHRGADKGAVCALTMLPVPYWHSENYSNIRDHSFDLTTLTSPFPTRTFAFDAIKTLLSHNRSFIPPHAHTHQPHLPCRQPLPPSSAGFDEARSSTRNNNCYCCLGLARRRSSYAPMLAFSVSFISELQKCPFAPKTRPGAPERTTARCVY
jgi:hypothetical protein